MRVPKSIRQDAERIGEILRTISEREPALWHKDDFATMELLLACALGAKRLGGGRAGDMVLTATIDLPGVGPVRYIIDGKMGSSGRGRADTQPSGVRGKLRELIAEGEQVIHATLWVNANGKVTGAGLFRFYEGFENTRWKRMEPLTEVSDMNDLAKPAKLLAFRKQVLDRLRRTDPKSYADHVAEAGIRFADAALEDVVLGYKAVEVKKSKEAADRKRLEAAAYLLGLSTEELQARLAGESS